ncbi:hypothetical protein GJ496_000107 [Pomphorhynchus laevis]|nr:hypothetical protein GJ496_000107 [Pomphorhynchus laevis]
MWGHGLRRILCNSTRRHINIGLINRPPLVSSIYFRTFTSEAQTDRFEFKAETRKLLDIVARSLYSDKEVFLRELISNASDSLEKQRLIQSSHQNDYEPLKIEISPNMIDRTLTIRDNGIGMTKDELIRHLGTIAHSGSKEFTEHLENSNAADITKIIGRFGVGFYSTFMVADNIQVISRSRSTPEEAWMWNCDGSSSYTISPYESTINFGSTMILHIKNECTNYLQTDTIKEIVKKYNNFISFPIVMNSETLNNQKPLWLEDPKNISDNEHRDFFRLITKTDDTPRYTLHYTTDAPLCIRAVIYVPKTSSPLASMLKENESSSGFSLYNRKVLITPNAKALLPHWLQFIKGVVDCEDIPLNLSREILQDSQMISRLRIVLTKRIVKFLQDERKKNEDNYKQFYNDYSLYLKEAIVRSGDQSEKQDIANLLLFQSSGLDENKTTTIPEYVKRMKPGQTDIYYISAPNRYLALNSPYFESFRQRKEECLLLCNTHDELVVLQLNDFAGKRIRSIEQEADSAKHSDDIILVGDTTSLTNDEAQLLKQWFLKEFKKTIKSARINTKLDKHPVSITTAQIGSVRQFLRSPLAKQQPFDLYNAVHLNLEFNPKHDLIKKVNSMRSSDEPLARQLSEQLIENALVIAGISEDPIHVISKVNDLLCKLATRK